MRQQFYQKKSSEHSGIRGYIERIIGRDFLPSEWKVKSTPAHEFSNYIRLMHPNELKSLVENEEFDEYFGKMLQNKIKNVGILRRAH